MVALRSIVTALAGATLWARSTTAHSIRRNPIGYTTFVRDADINTPSHRVHSHSKFDLTFTLHNGREKFRLVLDPNHDIIPDDFTISHLDSDGSVRQVYKTPRSDHRVFRGHAFVERPDMSGWSKAGWARITVHQDGDSPVFTGAFRVDGDNHHIETADQYLKLRGDDDARPQGLPPHGRPLVVWRDSDILDPDSDANYHVDLKRSLSDEPTCLADSLDFNADFNARLQSQNWLARTDARTLFGRQLNPFGSRSSLSRSTGNTRGCPSTRRVALVGIATDCTYSQDFDNNKTAIQNNIVDMVNKASELYESSFNISLSILNLTISDKNCPASASPQAPWNLGCSDSFNLTDRLSAFSQWRSQFNDRNAYWTLMSKCRTKEAVGLAWQGQLCRSGANTTSDNSVSSSANVVVRLDGSEWQVFAHETGHTFGAFHDCDSNLCATQETCCPLSSDQCDANRKFIMNPTTGANMNSFSPCSIGNICSGLQSSVNSNCLTANKNVNSILGSKCGNGIVESGEDCDCGTDQECRNNKCCDAKTCKFTSGSVCDPSNESCCTGQCQFANRGTVCRGSTGECDPEETCTGDHAGCPDDKHKEDGDACGQGLNCASGQCTSRDLQCKAMASSFRGFNSTRACPGDSCRMSCASADIGSDDCFMPNQNFLDGTMCGGGGKCNNGSCKGSSTIKEIGNWIQDHKGVFIPIVSVVGGLLAIAILSSIISGIRRRIRRRRLMKAAKLNSWPSYNGPGGGGGPPGRRDPRRQWSDSSGVPMFNGYNNPYPPPPPPPFAEQPNRWGEPRRSMRYA
ncbi:hypothetical protein CDD83_4762 [Cordyceps sp. RAO-2017]|nr:hypothetical protein CDD83_4762 [Cordyceps sp. RAO-2017]